MRRTMLLTLGVIFLLPWVVPRTDAAGSEPWQPVSGPYGGSVAVLALSPNYAVDHTVFAGQRGQGIYRTVDGGISWQQASPDGWVVNDLEISPAYAADGTLFAVQGLWTTGYRVYRSEDEGSSWQEVTPAWAAPPDAPRLAIAPDYAGSRTLYLLGGSRTYLSTDGGDTFVPLDGWFATHAVAQLAFSPVYADDRTLFALVPGEGLYRSSDGGATWELTGLAGDLSTIAVSPGHADDRMLLAVGADGHVSRSMDGGDTWTPGLLALAPGGQHTLLFSPSFGAGDRVVLAASSEDPGPYRSEDGGDTWLPAGWYDPAHLHTGGFVGGSVQALALAPTDAWDAAGFAGTSSGLYSSNNRGASWFYSHNHLARLTIRALAVAPGEPGTLLAGTSFFEHLRFDTSTPGEYDGGLQLSTDGGRTWRDVSGRLDRVQNIAFSPDFAEDRTAFASAGTLGQHGYFDGGVYRSTNGGQDWAEVLGDRICQALAVSPDFASDRTLWVSASTYAEAMGLYVSDDGGGTWAPLAPNVHAQALVPSPNFALDQTLFAGTHDGGLQRSTDGGLTWSQILSGSVTALAVSPIYGASRTLYAGMRETLTSPGTLYRSTDGGESWQLADTGIPAEREGETVTISTPAFAADGSILAGITYGAEGGGGSVYRSADGGDTWYPLGNGLESYSLLALATALGRPLVMYAGTDGGLWHLDLFQGGPAEPGIWTSGGPRGGRAQALAVSPGFEHDGVVMAGEWVQERGGGQSGLGMFRSADGGETWAPSAGGTELMPYSSAVHEYDFGSEQEVFAATWGGLLKSTDGGQNWSWLTRLYSGPFGSITAVAAAPDYAASGHVLAADGWGGLHLSRDGGINWTSFYTVTASSSVAYSPDFATDGMAFAGGWGLYRTVDGGVTWTQVLTQGVSALAVSPQFGTDETLFAGGDGLYISHDAGTGWISATLPTDPPVINALAVSPAFGIDRMLFAGINAGLYRSQDGGLSWGPVAGWPGLAVRSLAISPGWPAHPVMLAGTDEGVYRTADGGYTWARMQGLTPLPADPVALGAGEGLLVAGTYRHGVHGSTDGGASWFPLGLQGKSISRITGLALSPAYAADGTMYAVWGSTVSIGGGIYRTTDRGATWEDVYSAGYVGPRLALSPQFANDGTIFATREGAYVVGSEDGGDTWSPVGEWPDGMRASPRLVALPPNYPADGTLFAGGDGFWRLPTGAELWEPAASGLISDTYLVSLAVSPAYALDQTLLAIATWQEGPSGPLHYGQFRSTDSGLNWTLSMTGLPDTVLRQVVFSPRYVVDHSAYLTSEEQLYRSLDGGQSWTALGAPPGMPDLYGLAVNRQGAVSAASNAGVWHYTTPAQDLVVDGGFEAGSGWDLPATPRPARYSRRVVYDGAGAMGVGIDNAGNVAAYSSARQTVTIPADAITATLRCTLYPASGDSVQIDPDQAFPLGRVPADPARTARTAGDAQYSLLLGPGGGIVETLFWDLSNDQAWQPYAFDLTAYAGQTLVLHFGTRNDGANGRTVMYVDDVSLVVARQEPAYRRYLPLAGGNYR